MDKNKEYSEWLKYADADLESAQTIKEYVMKSIYGSLP
jgi:hypothetical protein